MGALLGTGEEANGGVDGDAHVDREGEGGSPTASLDGIGDRKTERRHLTGRGETPPGHSERRAGITGTKATDDGRVGRNARAVGQGLGKMGETQRQPDIVGPFSLGPLDLDTIPVPQRSERSSETENPLDVDCAVGEGAQIGEGRARTSRGLKVEDASRSGSRFEQSALDQRQQCFDRIAA
jgi:hypothetical protein